MAACRFDEERSASGVAGPQCRPRQGLKAVARRAFSGVGCDPAAQAPCGAMAVGWAGSDERWQMEAEIEKLGVGTFRADWISEDHRLRVSATEAPTLRVGERCRGHSGGPVQPVAAPPVRRAASR